jgi:hypothetical protein
MYLWKEWREQRAAVLALAIVLPALVLTISASMPRKFLGDATFTAAVVLIALAATLVAIVGELLTADRHVRGPWLERLPGGLPAAFPAKLLVFGLATVAALATGFALGLVGTFLEGREVLARACASILEEEALGGIFGVGLVLACWTFAASAWCTRGMLALCAGAVLAAGLGWPVMMHGALGYQADAWELAAALAVLVGGALVSAWVGFVHGQRLGRGVAARALRGIGTGALCVLPVWGWSLHRTAERERLVLAEADVDGVWVFQDGRKALLAAWMQGEHWEGAYHVVLADLERGTWQRMGGRNSGFTAYWSEEHEPLAEPDLIGVFRDSEWRVLDARDASPRPSAELGDPEDSVTIQDAGHGWYYLEDDLATTVYVDPYHDLALTPAELELSVYAVSIGPDGWLIDTYGSGWFEYLPDSGLRPAPWLSAVYELGPALADGRVLAVADGWSAVLVDPRARSVSHLTIPGTDHVYSIGTSSGRGYFRMGEPLLIDSGDERFLLDAECLELRPLDETYAGELLRALPDGTLLFATDEGIVRRDAASGERTLVFSFANAREVEVLEP